ncbi:MAG: hypothetical protein JST48_14730 [Bacteroidetes bacterium]|nr:hypothetical protein [Bacteroidota bacterium]
MQSLPSSLYSQCVDKQRIVVVGKHKARITELIAFVLKFNKRKIDLSTQVAEHISDAPTIIIEGSDQPGEIANYQHHIIIFSQLNETNKNEYAVLADATPKSGGIFYDETDSLAKSIATKERTDVVAIPFGKPKSETLNGKVVLVSSSKEKFLVNLSSDEDLKCCNAAKELVKKIGITSEQFYKAISAF